MTRTAEHRESSKSHTGDNYQKFLRAARDGDFNLVLELLNNGIKINVSNQIGLNALHLASKENHLEIVNELIKRGCDVEAVTKKGNTPLHIASLAGNFDIVKLLLDNKANVNRQSLIGFTPLYMAAQENHLDIVNLLLSRGANQALTTNDGFTPLAVALQQGHEKVVTILLEKDNKSKTSLPALHIAARKDDVNSVNLLLSNPNANVNHQSLTGFTPLHIAAHYGNMQVAKCLIQKSADVNFQARNNITPLHVAAKWGKLKMAQLLIENGALIDCKTRDGLTPLHCAARSGFSDVCELLMDSGAHPSAKTRNGLTPLHMAAQGNNDEVARILILRGAGLEDITGDYLSPLHVAAHCGNEKVATILLQRKCDVNPRALNGFTPLHIACKKGREGMVDLLIKYNSQISSTTELGLSPLHVSAFIGNVKIVQKLLKAGAEVDQRTMRSETPLHLAVRNCQLEVAELLINKGAKVDAPAKDNETPLDIAVFTGHPELVVLLLKNGSDPNIPTKDAYTALHFAAKTGNTEIIKSLLDSGANLLARNKKGFTCLHFAAKHGRVKAAKMLLSTCQKTLSKSEYQNFVNAKARNDLTAIHIATHYNKLDMVQLLIDSDADLYCKVSNGYTLLHMAAKFNYSDIATLILAQDLDQKKELPNSQSNCGFTPLHLAVQSGYCDLTSLLLQHGADVNHQAKNGLSALHLAAQEDRVQIAQILVAAGCNLSPTTLAGYTPLHTAAHFGQENMVRFLLNQKKVLVNEKISSGFTPLHLSSQQGHTKVVQLLLDSGADPNITNQNGLTAAHLAQQQHYVSIFDQLKKITTIVKTWEMIEIKEEPIQPEVMGEIVASDSEDETAMYVTTRKDQMQLLREKEDNGLKNSILPGEKIVSDSLNVSPTLKGKVLRLPEDGSNKFVEDTEEIWNQMNYIKDDQMNLKNTMSVSPGNTLIVENNESFNATSEMRFGKAKIVEYTNLPPSPIMSNNRSGTLCSKNPRDEFQMDMSYNEKMTKSITTVSPSDLRIDNNTVNNILSTDTNEWAIEATSNLDVERKPIESWRDNLNLQEKKIINFTAGKNSFLASFLVDARGCLLQAQRYPLLRIFIPPNAVTGPTRILMRLNRIPVAMPQLNDGDGLGCRIIEMSPVGIKFNSPVLFEIPYNADIESKDRELIVLRSENGSSWKEQTVDPSNHAIQQSLGVYFENVLPKEELKNNRVHRILTHDIPQYFAIITRIKQDLVLIGPDGGFIHSTVVPAVRSEFPSGALHKRIRVGLQAQAVDPELVSKIAGDRVSVSPIVTIEPRRRKFHKPIVLTIPLPKTIIDIVQQKGKKINLNEISSLRLLCSISGGTAPAFWEDITGSTMLNLVKNCAQFTTTVSARLWLFDCPNIPEVTEIATKIYREATAVPYIGRMAIYGRRSNKEEAQLRCIMLTDDNIDKTLECQEGFHLITTSPETRVLQNHTYWLETSGNLIPFTKATEQLSIGVRAFEENRLNLGVRLKSCQEPARGKFAFVQSPTWHGTLPASQRDGNLEKPITIIDVSLPEVGMQPKVPFSTESSPKISQQMNKTILSSQSTTNDNKDQANDIAKTDLDLKTIADNIKNDWERVGKSLGVDTTQIAKKHENNDYNAAYATLEEWKRLNPSATGNQLQISLQKLGLETVIKSSIKDAALVKNEKDLNIALKELQPEFIQDIQLSPSVKHSKVDKGESEELAPTVVNRRPVPVEVKTPLITPEQKQVKKAEIEDILAKEFSNTVDITPKIRPNNDTDKTVVEEEIIQPIQKKRNAKQPTPDNLDNNDLIQPVKQNVLKSGEPESYLISDYGEEAVRKSQINYPPKTNMMEMGDPKVISKNTASKLESNNNNSSDQGVKEKEVAEKKDVDEDKINKVEANFAKTTANTMDLGALDDFMALEDPKVTKKAKDLDKPKVVCEEPVGKRHQEKCGEHKSTWGKPHYEDCKPKQSESIYENVTQEDIIQSASISQQNSGVPVDFMNTLNDESIKITAKKNMGDQIVMKTASNTQTSDFSPSSMMADKKVVNPAVNPKDLVKNIEMYSCRLHGKSDNPDFCRECMRIAEEDIKNHGDDQMMGCAAPICGEHKSTWGKTAEEDHSHHTHQQEEKHKPEGPISPQSLVMTKNSGSKIGPSSLSSHSIDLMPEIKKTEVTSVKMAPEKHIEPKVNVREMESLDMMETKKLNSNEFITATTVPLNQASTNVNFKDLTSIDIIPEKKVLTHETNFSDQIVMKTASNTQTSDFSPSSMMADKKVVNPAVNPKDLVKNIEMYSCRLHGKSDNPDFCRECMRIAEEDIKNHGDDQMMGCAAPICGEHKSTWGKTAEEDHSHHTHHQEEKHKPEGPISPKDFFTHQNIGPDSMPSYSVDLKPEKNTDSPKFKGDAAFFVPSEVIKEHIRHDSVKDPKLQPKTSADILPTSTNDLTNISQEEIRIKQSDSVLLPSQFKEQNKQIFENIIQFQEHSDVESSILPGIKPKVPATQFHVCKLHGRFDNVDYCPDCRSRDASPSTKVSSSPKIETAYISQPTIPSNADISKITKVEHNSPVMANLKGGDLLPSYTSQLANEPIKSHEVIASHNIEGSSINLQYSPGISVLLPSETVHPIESVPIAAGLPYSADETKIRHSPAYEEPTMPSTKSQPLFTKNLPTEGSPFLGNLPSSSDFTLSSPLDSKAAMNLVMEEIPMPKNYPICGEHESTWGQPQGADCHEDKHHSEDITKPSSKLKENK